MPVPSAITDLSTTPASNSPAGSESPAVLDDYLRAHAAFIAQLRDRQPSFRNKIINGKMEIAQRGTSFPAAAFGAYTLDRWAYASVGSVVATISQQADAPVSNEFQSSLRATITTADTSIAPGDYALLTQRVEGFNVRDLIGRTFTLSFWVRSSKTGTHCVSLGNAGGNRSLVLEYTVIATNTWEFKTITVTGGLITAGTWDWTIGIGINLRFIMASGTTYQSTAGAWQVGDFLGTSNQVNCLDTVGNIFAITGVQLEVGSVATPFEHRPYGQEMELCRRYYRSTAFRHTVSLYAAGAYDSISFPTDTMRATPTMGWNVLENSNATNFASVSASQFAFTSVAAGACIVGGVVTQASEL